MGFFKDMARGVRAYGPASRLLFSRGMWHFMLWPFVAAVVVFVVLGLLVGWLAEWSDMWLMRVIAYCLDNTEGVLKEAFVRAMTGVLVWLLSAVLYFMVALTFGGYLVMMILSPVFSWLSERGEKLLTGMEYPFSWRQFGRDIWRGLLVALRGMFLQFAVTLVVLVFSIIPVVGLAGPFLLFLVGTYFYGFTFMDYAIERKRLRARETERFVWRHAGVAVGVGAVFMVAMMIPGIRWFACCFVSLLSVLAGTVVVNEIGTGTVARPREDVVS